jgi:hypothetical protein
MKDIVVKWKWIKRELIWIFLLYILANLINLVSILVYKTDWGELFTSQLFVLYLTEWLYVISAVARLIYFGIRALLKTNTNS